MTKHDLHSLKGFDSFDIALGDELRGERATLGKSLLDVQRELRIKAAYVAAIENADLTVFPDHGFVAGYVRSYARYLGLNPDSIFERFCHESGFAGVNAGMQPRGARAGKGVSGQGPIVRADDPLNSDRLSRLGGGASVLDVGASVTGLASLAVLATILLGIGYGGWSLLQEVQRVQLGPVDQAPVVLDRTAEGFIANPETPLSPTADLPFTDRAAALERLYAPAQTQPAPLVAPRDGPIGTIRPASVGIYAPSDEVRLQQQAGEQAAALPLAEPELAPVMTTPDAPPIVAVLAMDAAWIRVTSADGSSIFERILDPGTAYILPADVEQATLRAGNAGAVFLQVGEQAFGPLGTGARVARDVSLQPEDILTTWPDATLTAAMVAAMAQPTTTAFSATE